MPRVGSSVVVERPVDEVFRYVAEWSNATAFTEGLVRWEPLTDVTDAVGALFLAVMTIGPTTQRSTLEIVRRARDEEIAWESRAGFEQCGGYTFAAVGGYATRVAFRMDVTLPGGVAGRLLDPLVAPLARENTARSLGNLKRILES